MMQQHIPDECRTQDLPSARSSRTLANLNNMNCVTINGQGSHRTTVPHLDEKKNNNRQYHSLET
jgi:hypothetical protein